MNVIIGNKYKSVNNGDIVEALSVLYSVAMDRALRFDCRILESKTPERVGKMMPAFVDYFEPVSTYKNDVYDLALKTWGERSQFEMAQEEATELALAVRKYIRVRNSETYNAMCGEIADVEIMIEQLKRIMSRCSADVERIKIEKIERLAKRLDKGSFE